ncbi:MAG TPA: ATP-binding protein, partial [Polyangia bacterium]|nr:ATP-binding protein [Polyangia bacterium]
MTRARTDAAPFADDAEYLEAVCARVRLRLERALAVAASDDGGKADLARSLGERGAALDVTLAARVAAMPVAPGIVALQTRFGLDDEDVHVLQHVAAAQLDPTLAKLHTRLSGTAFHPWLDVGLVVQVHHDGVAERLRARARFAADAPLLAHRLVTLDRARPDAKDNLLACELKLPPRVARVVLGQNQEGLSGQTATYAKLSRPEVALDDVVLPAESRAELEQLLAAQPGLSARLHAWGYDRLLPQGRAVAVLFVGGPGTGKTTLAAALAKRLSKQLLTIDGARLAEAGRALENDLDELFLEARLADAVVLFDNAELLFGGRGARQQALLRALDRAHGLVILTTATPERLDATLDRRILLRLMLEVPTGALREPIWRQLLLPTVPLAEDVDINHLAKRYELSGGSIRSAVLYAVSKAVARGPASLLTMADLDAAAQAQLRGDLGGYADRARHGKLTLDVLVLPHDERSQIEEIIAAGRNRAKVLHTWG